MTQNMTQLDKKGQKFRLEWRRAEELKSNPRNWRRHPKSQQYALQELMTRVGWAVQFVLERKGRDRGWGNATQIEHAGQINVSHEARPVLDTAAIVQELKSMFGPAGEDLPDTFELTDD